MNEEQKEVIIQFFEATEALKRLDIIRSSKYTGDIAEFICSEYLGINLSKSGREKGLDGRDGNDRRVQVKYHGGESGTNIQMDKYKEGKEQHLSFDDLIVVLGPGSKIRPSFCEGYISVFGFKDYFQSGIHNIAKKSFEKENLLFELDKNLDCISQKN